MAPGSRRWRWSVLEWLLPLALIGVLLLAWELVARLVVADELVVPAPSQVGHQLWADRDLYPDNVRATVSAAARGFLWGSALAIGAALVLAQLGVFTRPALRVIVAFYCLPIIAIAPLLQAMLSGDAPRVALAAMATFFPVLLGALLGLRSADRVSLEVVHAFGGGRWDQLRRVRLRAALPALFAGLCIAAPGALLGATIGEFLGADAGLGVLMVGSLSSIETARAWGVALVSALLAGGAYAVISAVGRLLSPWSGTASGSLEPPPPRRARAVPGLAALETIGLLVASTAATIGIWVAALELLNVPPFIARGPGEVWTFFVTAPTAAVHRTQVFDALAVTAGHAVLGYALGTAVALALATAFALNRILHRAAMPVVIALQSIPIVAVTPIVVLALGRGLTTTLVIAALVTFFPTLVNLLAALRRTATELVDLVVASGGSRFAAMRKAQLPTAIPALLVSARIAAPAALLGVIVAEWLATGQGVGSLMVVSAGVGQFDVAWSAGVAVTVLSVLFYGAVSLVERPALARFAPEQLAP